MMTPTAIRMHVKDTALHGYIQTFPFLTGPDEDANRRALEALRAGTQVIRRSGAPVVSRLAHAAMALPQAQADAACALLRSVGLAEPAIENALHDFGWRLRAVPMNCRSVLCLGSGTGEELAFLRARAPAARIVVMDFVGKVWPGLLEAVGAQFIQCNMVTELGLHAPRYDLVFSNHTLEHMFDPDTVLWRIHQRLEPGGMLVSGLPLDADMATPLLGWVIARCEQPGSLNLVDIGLLDAGHPWKTNATDLRQTLQEAGFSEITITQRDDVPFRTALHERSGPWFLQQLAAAGNTATFDLLRRLLRTLFPGGPPLLVRRVLVGLERQVPFGANRLKNRYAPDVVFTAVRR